MRKKLRYVRGEHARTRAELELKRYLQGMYLRTYMYAAYVRTLGEKGHKSEIEILFEY